MARVQMACRKNAAGAAERIAPAAQRTRVVAADRFMVARGWGAPRLRRASKYVEGDLGPRVSSMLSTAARRVEPSKPAARRRNVAVTMLGATMAVGLAGALLTRRSNAQSSQEATETERTEVRT